jgi:ParB-like chromosome segregation protein Spo0J
MTHLEILEAARDRAGGYKVDVSRGERIGRVSSEWFSRPADERYLSLSDLYAAVRGRTERSRTRTVESAAIRVEASRDDAERLALMLPGSDAPIAPTHWSFGQLAGLVGAPAAYLRQLPAPLAGINLQYGLTSHRAEQVKTLEIEDGRVELRAVTGPDYGRIFDHELVSAVQRIAGNGTGDTRWKVPGVLDWSTGIYNPRVDVTQDTTTLAEEDSLAENVQRAPLHPLDQFRAFLALREKGQSEEEIAAAFFVSVNVVKQRLKLASVSPALLEIYAEDGMTLDQLMAFTVSGDHERQEQVFERLKASYDKQPYVIRRMLTEGAVRASDKRVQFIGIDAYVAAGGTVPAALITGIRSDLPGEITAQVTEAVYDTPTGKYLLIPQGARLIGKYDSSVAFGQNRVLLVWTRLIMPNGTSIVLEQQPGADTQGYAGLEDDVDNHWAMLIKAAMLSTLLSVGAEAGTSSTENSLIQAIRGGASNSISQTGRQIVQRQLNIQPTLTIRPGFPVRVLVSRDLILTPYGQGTTP